MYVGGVHRNFYKSIGPKSGTQQFIDICGGRNIFADISEAFVTDPEAVVERNPDVIITYIYTGAGYTSDTGYEYDEPSEIKVFWEDIMNRPELANVNAVKNRRVYIIDSGLNYGLDYPIALAYWAKWFHPELFKDLDPKAIHQEFLRKFPGLDYDLDKHGVFVYHPEEHLDGH